MQTPEGQNQLNISASRETHTPPHAAPAKHENGHSSNGRNGFAIPPGTTATASRIPVKRLRAPVVKTKSVVPGMEITANSYEVLKRRYLSKDRDGKTVETPVEMFWRVARNLAEGEAREDPMSDSTPIANEFFQMLATLEFLPNSPTLMNAGRELQQLSACFVLPVPDDMEGIFESAKHTALIHKSGGGTGFAFSRLRPENDVVGSTGGIASGPVSFIKIFDTATDVVKQGGTRRGANMGILNVTHPDILKFIHAKDDDKSLQNFNISVALTEDFMKAVIAGGDYDLLNPRSKKPAGKMNAKKVFDELVNSAWKTGDPGIIFIDRINATHTTPHISPIEATNPCGEQPLMPYESCNLGSVNLAKMVDADDPERLDWARLEKTVFTAVRFLDNVVTMNKYPVAEIERITKGTRKIGLGVMGWADLLLMLGVPYDSEEAVTLAEKVAKFIQDAANEASMALAEERGEFPFWHGSVYDRPGGPLLRNSTRTTIAPTGTISIIAGCSSGIEPLFAVSYVRNVMDNTKLIEVNPHFEELAKHEGFYSKELMEKIAEHGSCRGIPEVPQWVQRLFATSHDIAPEWHVRMQAAWQKYCDNAVSKTVNLANGAGVEDVRTVYTLAYETGCKGVTIYRDGSKGTQVLSTGQTEKAREKGKEQAPEAKAGPPPAPAAPKTQLPMAQQSVIKQAEEIASGPVPLRPRERPATVSGVTHRVRTGNGTMYITVNFDESGKPFEVFSALGKGGSDDAAYLEAISRLLSLALRAGVDIESIVKQLRGITCNPTWDNGVMVRSAPDAVALALSRHIEASGAAPTAKESFNERTMEGAQLGLFIPPQAAAAKGKAPEGVNLGNCPECGSSLAFQEGCLTCHSCGFNKCG
jgi:ribonucleoside-diphosphate reductase alpha chain